MELSEGLLVAAAVLIVVVAVSILSSRIGIAAPLILVVLGMGVGYIPGIPLIEIDPEIILVAVLPPLLYSAAVNVPVLDLRRNLGPIAGLSVALVIISAGVVGALLHLAVPAIPLAAAVALGAVVAPTDAVAATAIGKRLGMPPRLVTILEGESLVNDATSLVLLRTAIAATAGTFAFWETLGIFVYAVAVASLIGLAIGFVTVGVRARLSNPVYDTVISFTVPFIAFVPAEAAGGSGVIAVVVAGLFSGHQAAKRFSAHARINERLNWRTVQFLLEHGVFLLMGLELHALLTDVSASTFTLAHTGLIGLGIVAALLLLRMAFMAPLLWSLKRTLNKHRVRASGTQRAASRARELTRSEISTETQEIRAQRADRIARRSAADLEHAHSQGLNWRGGFTLGWSGMRGVVTLAAAQSIPNEVPYRSQLVLIAFIVAVVTLLLHGLSLPAVIRWLRPRGPSHSDRAEELVGLYTDLSGAGTAALEAALEREQALAHENPAHAVPSDRVIRRAQASVHEAVAPLGYAVPRAPTAAPSAGEQEALSYLRLARVALEAQRSALLEERAIGQYDSAALRLAEEALDAHELRLTPPTAPH
ncbi:cation:proton antiporter [Leucobacter sp. W1153]|uniref:cation:proton antiporter n=1 Tax=Leucobacter sp. W1153 TaxID=3439064 RepID=UPI003F2EC05E